MTKAFKVIVNDGDGNVYGDKHDQFIDKLNTGEVESVTYSDVEANDTDDIKLKFGNILLGYEHKSLAEFNEFERTIINKVVTVVDD